MPSIDSSHHEKLFFELYQAAVEAEVDEILEKYGLLDEQHHWHPYGNNPSNYGVVENQQASPIPAIVEKLTNGIDAILERRCLEEMIDPKSDSAPRSMEKAIEKFFPGHGSWDLPKHRKIQSEALQILADGPRGETSLTIYDDGVGQHPEDFPDTFLSLLRGNKNEIHFVQGKYNMGGAGAVVFCGRKRYQLIGSKRFDGTGDFGFTLVRRHPLTDEEEKTKKATWYEYLVLDEKIPSFPCDTLDLGLHNRKFKTGSILKLYSYDLPAGSKSVISRDLNQSLNEYLFQPALPVLTVDNEARYPDDKNLERDLYGLKRRLEEDDSKYIDETFSEEINDAKIGTITVKCYVFTPKLPDRSSKETKQTIRREFFKNDMSVLFSMNGQVHGHFTSEFITRSLKFHILKDYLLIHVDCSQAKTEFRNELFMASRDRLKEADEARELRKRLARLLSGGRLKEIYKNRKASISVDSSDAEEMLRNVSKNLPMQSELAKLLNQTFKLESKDTGKSQNKNKKDKSASKKQSTEEGDFISNRFPSSFKLDTKDTKNQIPLIKIPKGSSKEIRFSTDVEDEYFDRSNEPGSLALAILNHGESGGGDTPSPPNDVSDMMDIVKSSPSQGIIRISIAPTDKMSVGDSVKMKASLSSPEGGFDQIFEVKIVDKTKKKPSTKKELPEPNLGLPQPVMVYEKPKEGGKTWDDLEQIGISMDHEQVVYPSVEGDALSAIYVNMDSTVIKNYRSTVKSEEAIKAADNRYFSAVYFHSLFLFATSKSQNFTFGYDGKDGQSIDIEEYIQSIFKNSYARFLLNFDMDALIAALD